MLNYKLFIVSLEIRKGYRECVKRMSAFSGGVTMLTQLAVTGMEVGLGRGSGWQLEGACLHSTAGGARITRPRPGGEFQGSTHGSQRRPNPKSLEDPPAETPKSKRLSPKRSEATEILQAS